MPTNLSRLSAHRPTGDPRFLPGAYITDGEELYYVRRSSNMPVPPGPRVLVVEDCKTMTILELDFTRVARRCRLVRAAPDEDAAHPETLGVA